MSRDPFGPSWVETVVRNADSFWWSPDGAWERWEILVRASGYLPWPGASGISQELVRCGRASGLVVVGSGVRPR